MMGKLLFAFVLFSPTAVKPFDAGLSAVPAPGVAALAQDKHPVTGVFKGDLYDDQKKLIMRVIMQAPSKLPEEKVLGLLVLHHGFRGNEGNYFPGTVEALKRLGLTEHYVVIAGKSKGEGWTPADDEAELRLHAWAKKTYPIDPRRVYIFGSSNGAAYVGRFGWEHQDILAAVVGYCGSYNFSQQPANLPKAPPPQGPMSAAETKTEWYFVHGGDDSPQNSRRGCDELKQKGYRYVFRQLDGYGHTDIWDGNGHPDRKLVDAVRDDWISWIHALRHKEIAPAPDEKKALSSLTSKVKTEKLDTLGAAIAEIARIGGAPGGKIIGNAYDSPDAEVRAAAVATGEKTLYARENVLELVKLLRDKSEAVKQAAVKGLGVAANYRYAEAQDALIRTARSRNTPAEERVRAVEALARAVALCLPGNFEDKLLVWTLVLLLDDDDQKVREAAFAVLKEAVKESGYDPAGPSADRKAAVAKFRTWCTQKCGPLEAAASAK
jgi:hypothetical protein